MDTVQVPTIFVVCKVKGDKNIALAFSQTRGEVVLEKVTFPPETQLPQLRWDNSEAMFVSLR